MFWCASEEVCKAWQCFPLLLSQVNHFTSLSWFSLLKIWGYGGQRVARSWERQNETNAKHLSRAWVSGVVVVITGSFFRKPSSPLCKTNIQPSRPSFIREQFSQEKKWISNQEKSLKYRNEPWEVAPTESRARRRRTVVLLFYVPTVHFWLKGFPRSCKN